MNNSFDKAEHDEIVFELKQENARLRGQITYLQEELSTTEDAMAKKVDQLNTKIEFLENEIGR